MSVACRWRAPAAAPSVAAAAAASVGETMVLMVDWSNAGERLITLFYRSGLDGMDPGRQVPRRRAAIRSGDRCVTCHDGKTADMGKKMVTGTKAETTPIPGKRPGIPVTVQATHDADNLYLRFQWEDTEHVAVPFVDGGKMDPANQVKLAVMLATDEVSTPARPAAGAPDDLRTMPGHRRSGCRRSAAGCQPGGDQIHRRLTHRYRGTGPARQDFLAAGTSSGSAAIEAELANGQIMDLLRVNSGDGSTEDGYVLAERMMVAVRVLKPGIRAGI